MQEDVEQLLRQQYSKVRKRLAQIRLLLLLQRGAAAGAAAAVLWSLLGLVVPIAGYRYMAPAWLIVGLLAAAGVAWVRRPTEREAARAMDAGGLEERAATALAFLGDTSPISRLQREDAAVHGAAYVGNLHHHLPLIWVKRSLGILLGAIMASAVLLLLPNPMDQRLAEQRQERQWVEERQKEIAQELVELEKQEKAQKLPSDKLEELKQSLSALEKDLKDASNAEEALAKMEAKLNELKRLVEEQERQAKLDGRRMSAWSAETDPALQAIAKAAASRSAEAVAAALDGLKQAAAERTPEERRQLAERLSALAQSAEADAAQSGAEAAQAARAEAEALASLSRELAAEPQAGGDNAGPPLSEEALAALAQALESGAAAAGASQLAAGAAGQAAAGVARSGQSLAEQWAARGGAPGAAWGPQGLAGQLASANGASGQGAGSGAGQGSGSGAGQGVGSGTGQGAGMGSGSRSLVSVPNDSVGGGDPSLESGPLGAGQGEQGPPGGPAPASGGSSRPYQEVYAEYEAQASQVLGRSQIPESMKDLVRDYFTEINPSP